jgi:hypothetical protein
MTFIACMPGSSAYALTQRQQSVEYVIDADITWYDFGDYSFYSIYAIEGTGLYALSMGNPGSDEIGKTALVNASGEVVLEPFTSTGFSSGYGVYSGYGDSSYFYSNGEDYYIAVSPEGVRRIDGTAYSEIGTFHNGYAAVTLKQTANKGVIDENGNLIFEDKSGKYIDFTFIGGGIFTAKLAENSLQYLDMTGAPLTDTVYTADWWWNYPVGDERILASNNEKFGYLDLSGAEIIPLIYDDARPFSDGAAWVCREDKWGMIDPNGDTVIPIEFGHASSFLNNVAYMSKDEKCGLIDRTGTFVLPMEYDQITPYENGFIMAVKEGKAILTDASGQSLLTGEYSHIELDSSGHIGVWKTINGLSVSALLDTNENLLTGWKDFTPRALSERLYLGRKAGDYPPGAVPPHDYGQKFALLDANGDNLTGFKYANVGDFFNDYLVVFQYYYGNAGILNQYGAEVVPTIFDDVLLTDEGYAFITVRDDSDETYIGYFKIPDRFSEQKTTRPITVYLDGVELFFESEPMMINERTMVPLRKIFETLELAVDWDDSTRTVAVSGGGKTLRLTIGNRTAYVDGVGIRLDAAPFIQDDITFVPLRFVSENSGAAVEWDDALRRVIIRRL